MLQSPLLASGEGETIHDGLHHYFPQQREGRGRIQGIKREDGPETVRHITGGPCRSGSRNGQLSTVRGSWRNKPADRFAEHCKNACASRDEGGEAPKGFRRRGHGKLWSR